MDTVRFLLITPTSPYRRVENGGRPRGNRVFRFSMLPSLYVAASMPPWVETHIVDEDIESVDFDEPADLVGVSFMTYNAPRAYEIADRFRARGTPVVFGGYHPTFVRDEALEHADAICIGEAERNVPTMMADFRNGGLKPVYEAPLADLSRLPRPDRTLLNRSEYVVADFVQATRGCPYRCNFCSIARFNRFKYRMRPIEDVIDEISGLSRYLLFLDDNIIGSRNYALELFRAMEPLKKQWYSQSSVRMAFDDELLDAAARSGCRGLFVGFESLSQDNLDAVDKRGARARDYHRAIQRFHSRGIAVFAAFVFGMDEDDRGVFRRTLQFLHESGADAVQATTLTPFPGTPLYEEMERDGRIFERDWARYDLGHAVFEPKHMSAATLELGVSWVLWKFYSASGTARRTVRGLRYIGPKTMFYGVLPLNLGYRKRYLESGRSATARHFDA